MGISRQVPPPVPVRARGPGGELQEGGDVGVIIVAAGQGTRVGGGELKQFRWIAGKPMLLHSVQTFLSRPDVCSVVCVLPDRYAADPPPWLLQVDLNRLLLSVGGAERSDSVRNGLEDLVPEARVVLVHDAARPFVPADVIDRVVDMARSGVGAVPAVPVIDTLKQTDMSNRVLATVERTLLWRAQTPQGFPRALLERAYADAAAAGFTATDDAALVERLGEPVMVVAGSERAMKVTTDEDFARAEAMLRADGAPDERSGA